MTNTDVGRQFTEFVVANEPSLRRALVARYGADVGREATAEALAFGWRHWDRISSMSKPVGYLYRVAQTYVRRRHRRKQLFEAQPAPAEAWVEPDLMPALASLSERQRVAVLLIHGYGWTLQEVADLLGRSRSTVQRHLQRGMTKLSDRLQGVQSA